MTKERRLAIEMWKGIRSKIVAFDHKMDGADILVYKNEFCERHSLCWTLNCWFCQYIKARHSFGCKMCPLKDCGIGSLYEIVLSRAKDKDVRVSACNAIIKALGGEV